MSAETVEPTILIDTPEDYAVEEHAWVPLAMAKDKAAAIKIIECEFPSEDLDYEVIGRSFQRALPATGEDGAWFVLEDDGSEEDADGNQGRWSEYLPWQSCDGDAPGAVEFWDLCLVDPQEATR